MKHGKELIKQYYDNILQYQGIIEYDTAATLGSIKREVDKLYTRADLDKAVADEREACAKLLDIFVEQCPVLDDWDAGYLYGIEESAEAIRKRGKEEPK